MDQECATCFSLQEAIDALARICGYIDFSCHNKPNKEDFGLKKPYIIQQIRALEKAQHWHQYYHATGKSLSESNPGIESGGGEMPMFKRRWRPQ